MSKSEIVVSLLTKEQDYQAMQAADAERAATRAGLTVEIVYARNNGTLQVEQLYPFVRAPEAHRPVAIVVQTVAGEGLERVARDAAKAGIGWVLLSRDVTYIDSLRAEYPRLPIAIVTPDQPGIGRIQGRQFRALLPKGGNVLYVQGPPDTSAAQQRLKGMQEAIASANIEVTVVNGEWTEASGEKAVLSWLRLSSSQDHRIDLVAAQNDAMAIGARKALALRRPDLARVPFIGCDGLPDGGQRLVKEGQLTATVILPSCAGPAVDLVAAQLKSGSSGSARVILPAKAFPETIGER
jgi:ABC-type sugar transport system substrate-binding protein